MIRACKCKIKDYRNFITAQKVIVLIFKSVVDTLKIETTRTKDPFAGGVLIGS